MAKAFTKGEQVTLLQSWDNKGTVRYTHAIVHSCGVKQMVLTNEAGKELGRHFAPAVGSLEVVGSHNWEGTFKRMTDEQAEAACLIAGAAVAAATRAFLALRIEQNSSDVGFCSQLKRDMEEIHEPRALRGDGKEWPLGV